MPRTVQRRLSLFAVAPLAIVCAACERADEPTAAQVPDLAQDAQPHGAEHAAETDARIVPQDLEVSALAGGAGVLEITALTLRRGSNGVELYAALKNAGAGLACSAALSVELFDAAGRSLASGIAGLLSQRMYRLEREPRALAACIAPGEVSMAAVTDLPHDLALEEVKHLVYRCPYFALEATLVEGIALQRMKVVSDAAGSVYAGTLVNQLEVPVSRPSVSVFPLNRVGRPLGVTMARHPSDVEPGADWRFETDLVRVDAADYAAFPAAAIGAPRLDLAAEAAAR